VLGCFGVVVGLVLIASSTCSRGFAWVKIDMKASQLSPIFD
jgi:hypothetical protein